MANNTFLDSSQLDFDAYKTSLITYFKSQPRFKDYNFDGSNLSVLMDLLARNTYQNALLLNMIGSEAFLDTAQLRQSAVSKAKELNYLPRSRSSSSILANITVIPNDTPDSIVIPKYYNIGSSALGGTVIFSTDQAYVLTNSGGSYTVANVEIFEGSIITETFIANSSAQYIINSANVDTTSLSVNIQTSVSNTSNSNWSLADNLYGLNSLSQIYFLQGYQETKYEIVFGDDITGQSLEDGNIVTITYRDCSGDAGDGFSIFRPLKSIDGYTNISIIAAEQGTSSFGGSERESIDSIKFNAPRYFASQQRAITKNDYSTLIKTAFPQIESISVFGGEELAQKKYGTVVIAIRPFGEDFAPDSLKNLILAYLQNKCALTITPTFIDPDYYFVEVVSNVYFDPSKTSLGINDLQTEVLESIQQYANTNLFDFGSDLRYSKLVTTIDSSDGAIVSNDTNIRFIKRLAPTIGVSSSFAFSFENQLKITLGVPSVITSLFYYTLNGISYQSYMQDDGAGNLQIITINNNNVTTILNASIGIIDYVAGAITITNFLVDNYSGYISMFASLLDKDIIISKNQIIDIDSVDCTINVLKVVV